ncbi:hypothetical protein Tco_0534025 [Tanacetum coccineum]
MAKNSDEVFRVYVKGTVSDAREKHVFEVKKGFLVEAANGGGGGVSFAPNSVSISTPPKCQQVCSDLLEPIVTSKAPDVFNRMPHPHTMQFTNITKTSSKDGLTIIECKRGGDVFSDSHSNWLQTVSANPKAMLFKFVHQLLLFLMVYRGVDILVMRSTYIYAASHSNKPALEDLQCFLEFQVPRLWAPIFFKRDPNWLNQEPAGGVFIVTGPQLISKGKWPKTILHLRLHFTHIPNCTIRKTEWAGAPAVACKSSLFTNISSTFTFTQRSIANGQKQQQPATLNSSVFPDSPPVPVRSTKLCKYVDTDEVLTELYVTLAEKLYRLAVQLVADASGVESVKITCTSSRATDDLDTPLVQNLVAKGIRNEECIQVWGNTIAWKGERWGPKFDESRSAPRKQVVMVIGIDVKPSEEALKKIDEIPACFP